MTAYSVMTKPLRHRNEANAALRSGGQGPAAVGKVWARPASTLLARPADRHSPIPGRQRRHPFLEGCRASGQAGLRSSGVTERADSRKESRLRVASPSAPTRPVTINFELPMPCQALTYVNSTGACYA